MLVYGTETRNSVECLRSKLIASSSIDKSVLRVVSITRRASCENCPRPTNFGGNLCPESDRSKCVKEGRVLRLKTSHVPACLYFTDRSLLFGGKKWNRRRLAVRGVHTYIRWSRRTKYSVRNRRKDRNWKFVVKDRKLGSQKHDRRLGLSPENGCRVTCSPLPTLGKLHRNTRRRPRTSTEAEGRYTEGDRFSTAASLRHIMSVVYRAHVVCTV